VLTERAGTRRYKVYEVFVAVRKLDLQFSCIMLLTGFIFFQFTPQERVFLIPNVIVFCIEIVWERYVCFGPPGQMLAHSHGMSRIHSHYQSWVSRRP